MSEKQKKIYIGNGVKKNEGWLTSSLCLTDIPKEHVFEYQGKKYVKVNINVKDELDQYGKDVSVTVDTWKPDGSVQAKKAPVAPPPSLDDADLDSLPF
jgi:hypothetical protein